MADTIDMSLLVGDNHSEIDGLALFRAEIARQRKINPDLNIFFAEKKNFVTKDGGIAKSAPILRYDSKDDGRLSVVFYKDDIWDFYYRQPGESGLGIAVAIMEAHGSKVTLLDDNMKKMPTRYKNIVIDYQYNKEALGIEIERPSQGHIRITKLRNAEATKDAPAGAKKTDKGRDDR